MKKSSTRFTQLVGLLSDGHYHDGTTLGETLNTTRSAVWKAIKKLQSYGIQIDSIKGKGYALLEPLILLNQRVIQHSIPEQVIDLHCFETVTSTNDFLKQASSKKPIKICIAEQQTHGKGRLNRTWHSPFGHNLYLSCAYPFTKDISTLAGLSLVISLAIAATLAMYQVPDRLWVKWPNDILYHHQKLSGNLVEIQAESHGSCQAIIGIGINVNMLVDSETDITQPWTSLRHITSTYIDRNVLCVTLINTLLTYLQRFALHGIHDFIAEWREVDYLYNKTIALQQGTQKMQGKARGIDAVGQLVLELPNGNLQAFSSGDTSIWK